MQENFFISTCYQPPFFYKINKKFNICLQFFYQNNLSFV